VATTLLIGNARTTWREWLRENRHDANLLCLDPVDPIQLVPGVLHLFQGEKPSLSRFYGSTDPQRSPHVMIGFLAEALRRTQGELIIQLFSYRPTPLLRQTALLAAQLAMPDRILVAESTEIDQMGFPVGPEEIAIEPALPPMIQLAQRKAKWIKLLEQCTRQEVDLRNVTIEGSRLGSGRRLSEAERKQAGLKNALHAEAAGASLFVVIDTDLDEQEVSQALDFTGCSKAVITSPVAYSNLLCSFANQKGEDFANGVVCGIDWRSLRASVLASAVPPAPVRLLRLGSIRIDSDGRELGELRPWQV
jgi:hypothetical protein